MPLRDYSIYTDKVRQYAKAMTLDRAVKRAVEECIHDDILKEFLISQKAEAVKVSLYEFNQERYEKLIKEDARAKGRADCLLILLEQYGTVPDSLRNRIQNETDLGKLDDMFRRAVQLQSLEAFVQYLEKSVPVLQ